MTTLPESAAQRSNHTETAPALLRQRVNYMAAHRPYTEYLQMVLDRAWLPASTWALPNVTNIAAMKEELRGLNPQAPGINAVVLGRFLHRILHPLLTWHGGYHAQALGPCGAVVHFETTIYRLPEVQRARTAFQDFRGVDVVWSNDVDQWRFLGELEA